jgi:hypothetical protein
MAWVRSEYAGEFAVISAWLSMVLPWNIVYRASLPTEPLASEMTIIRFPLLEIQFRSPAVVEINGQMSSAAALLEQMYPGINLFSEVYLSWPVGASAHYGGYMQWGSLAWALGALAVLAAFAVSIAFYLREDDLQERLSADPVRLIGGLLGVATVATAAATVLYFLGRDLGGIPIPIGVLIMGALSVALLRVEVK